MGLGELTRQEGVVADAVRSGASTAAIAASLFLSSRTVETHLGAIYRKLGLHTRAELLAFLFAHDSETPDHPLPPEVDSWPHELVAAEHFVGRARERGALVQASADAKTGRNATVLVGGEPGIGKSALVAWLAGTLREEHFLILAGRCDSDFRAPFAPILDVVRPFLLSDDGTVISALGPKAGFLAPLLPELADVLPPRPTVEDSGTARRMLAQALLELITAAARGRPTLLVLEDLHWADRASLGLFRQLAESRNVPFLFLIGTFRNTELVREHPLAGFLANLWREPSVQRMELSGLDAGETGELADMATENGFDEDAVRALQVRTGGNPFFVLQLLQERTGTVLARDSLLPPSVREVVMDRAARLGADCLAMLQDAAVFGQEFAPRFLARASDAPFDDASLAALARSLGRATTAGFITDRGASYGNYRFSHDLVREAVLGELSAIDLALAHRRAGNAMLALSADRDPTELVALATHFGAAAVLGDGITAARFALEAARNAAVSLAPEDALAIAARGLEYLANEDDDQLRLDLLTVIVDAHATRMDLDAHRSAILEAVAVARRIGTPLALAQTVDRNTVLPVMGVLDEELLAVKEEAIAALGPEPSPLRTRLLVSASYQRTIGGHGWSATDQAERALADSKQLNDRESTIASLYALAAASAGKPEREVQLSTVNELIALSADPLGRVPEQDGRRFRAILRLAGGDRDGFEADMLAMSEFGESSGSVFVKSLVREWRAMLALLDGDLERAEELANDVLTVAGDDPNFLVGWLVQIIQIRLEQGRTSEARGMAEMALAQNPSLTAIRALAAMVRLAAEDGPGADELVAPLLSAGMKIIPEDWLRPATLGYFASVVTELGSADDCVALEACLEPYAGQMLIAGAGALVLGAADHLRATLLLAAGEGHRAAAVGLLGHAISLAESCGAVLLAERSRAVLRDALAR